MYLEIVKRTVFRLDLFVIAEFKRPQGYLTLINKMST